MSTAVFIELYLHTRPLFYEPHRTSGAAAVYLEHTHTHTIYAVRRVYSAGDPRGFAPGRFFTGFGMFIHRCGCGEVHGRDDHGRACTVTEASTLVRARSLDRTSPPCHLLNLVRRTLNTPIDTTSPVPLGHKSKGCSHYPLAQAAPACGGSASPCVL